MTEFHEALVIAYVLAPRLPPPCHRQFAPRRAGRVRIAPGATCAADGCDRPVKSLSLCAMHYQASRRETSR